MSSPSELRPTDVITRLVSTVLRFGTPEIKDQNKHISFVKSFKTVGTNENTKEALNKADAARSRLFYTLAVVTYKSTSCKDILDAADVYLPLIHQIIVSCKTQPESSRLDEKLVFEWKSGLEKKPHYFKGEMLMYELVMVISTKALATAGNACDMVAAGEFKEASIQFKKAASIVHHLAQDILPTWISKGNAIQEDSFPIETNVAICDAFTHMFLGMSQQMALATVLMKPDIPNYTLLSKLSLGIADQFLLFQRTVNSKAVKEKLKIDAHYFSFISFQIALQRGFAKYFQSLHLWENQRKYGIAISLMGEALSQLIPGLLDIITGTPLEAVSPDIESMRKNLQTTLHRWETDNNQIYFEKVPTTAPEAFKVKEGVQFIKVEDYKLVEGDALVFTLPKNATLIKAAQENDDRRIAQAILEEEEKKLTSSKKNLQIEKDKELAAFIQDNPLAISSIKSILEAKEKELLFKVAQEEEDRKIAQALLQDDEKEISSSIKNLQIEKDKELAAFVHENDGQAHSFIKSIQEEKDKELAVSIQENDGRLVSSVKAALEESDRELAIRLQKLLNEK